MIERTWPYGTMRRATVLNRIDERTLILVDDQNEGHILLGTRSEGRPGDKGTLIFRRGGPKGGYWFFEKDGPGDLAGPNADQPCHLRASEVPVSAVANGSRTARPETQRKNEP